MDNNLTMIVAAVTCNVINQSGITHGKNTLNTMKAEKVQRYALKLERAVRDSISDPETNVTIDALGDELDLLLTTEEKAFNLLRFCLEDMSNFKSPIITDLLKAVKKLYKSYNVDEAAYNFNLIISENKVTVQMKR